MLYDKEEIARRVAAKRKKFLILSLSVLIFMIAALVLIGLEINDTLTFLMMALEFASVFVLYSLCLKYTPTILFWREIRGTNVLEVEYVAVRYNKREGKYSPRGSSLRFRSTGANRKKIHDGNIRSTVYLRLDDGNVCSLHDLYKSSTDIYEIGDFLVKYSGVKYPVIENRTVERHPCPICGEINERTAKACSNCGLGIRSI